MFRTWQEQARERAEPNVLQRLFPALSEDYSALELRLIMLPFHPGEEYSISIAIIALGMLAALDVLHRLGGEGEAGREQ